MIHSKGKFTSLKADQCSVPKSLHISLYTLFIHCTCWSFFVIPCYNFLFFFGQPHLLFGRPKSKRENLRWLYYFLLDLATLLNYNMCFWFSSVMQNASTLKVLKAECYVLSWRVMMMSKLGIKRGVGGGGVGIGKE